MRSPANIGSRINVGGTAVCAPELFYVMIKLPMVSHNANSSARSLHAV